MRPSHHHIFSFSLGFRRHRIEVGNNHNNKQLVVGIEHILIPSKLYVALYKFSLKIFFVSLFLSLCFPPSYFSQLTHSLCLRIEQVLSRDLSPRMLPFTFLQQHFLTVSMVRSMWREQDLKRTSERERGGKEEEEDGEREGPGFPDVFILLLTETSVPSQPSAHHHRPSPFQFILFDQPFHVVIVYSIINQDCLTGENQRTSIYKFQTKHPSQVGGKVPKYISE